MAQDAFHRMILAADHWGVFHNNPSVLKGLLWPLREDVAPKDISGWIKEYVKNGMVRLFNINGTHYGYFTSWEKHQHLDKRIHRKYPAPPVDSNGIQGKTQDSTARKDLDLDLDLERKGLRKDLDLPRKSDLSKRGKAEPKPIKETIDRLNKTYGNQTT